MSKAQELVALLNSVRGEQEKFFNSLPEAERVANGTWEVWAPKDVIAHLAFWQNNLVKILNTLDQAPPDQEPFEVRNRNNYLHYENRPWSEVYAAYADSFDEIVARVKNFDDAELETQKHFARLPNGSLQTTVLGNSFTHTITHLAELVAKRDGIAAGQDLQERAVEKMLAFDSSPFNKGLAYYNLACSYSLSGNSERAIELLQEALSLRPDLVEFSKEDTDFNPIRSLPEFQALYAALPVAAPA